MDVVMHSVLVAVDAEMDRQDARHGPQDHADGYWLAIALDELGAVARAVIESKEQREVVIAVQQTAAGLGRWLECLHRRAAGEHQRR